jgi:NADH:ubiquinone reductase (H+-translocating)
MITAIANIPDNNQKRIVIAGAGFAGLKLARCLAGKDFQVVLIDKNNYHQFQPLFYQVASAGLEPSAISFPLRKIFQKAENVHIRMAEIQEVDTSEQILTTSIGTVHYDYLVIATGADTFYPPNENFRKYGFPMKSVSEALGLRNTLLKNFEKSLLMRNAEHLQSYLNIVIVGGGPTGVEVSGALAEMKKYVLPKDYPEIDFSKMNIFLVEASPRLLGMMSKKSSEKSEKFLTKLGVIVLTNHHVKDYDGKTVFFEEGETIESRLFIWAAGVKGNSLEGIPDAIFARGSRIKVNKYNQVEGFTNIFAIGDIAYLTSAKYPNGFPQLAQVAIQQARLLSKNIVKLENDQSMKEFHYMDFGSLATVGRNLAVVDLPFIKFQGTFAWFFWMFIHLMAIVGVKNRMMIFINWAWNYFTYDQSLRLIIKPKMKEDI